MQNLYRRSSGRWVVRLVVPERLRGLLDGRREFIRSTETTDIRVAKLVAGALLVSWRQQLRNLDPQAPPMPHSLLQIIDGSLTLRTGGHLNLNKAGVESGLGVTGLLQAASEGRLPLFWRANGAAGNLLQKDKLDAGGGYLVAPHRDFMPAGAEHHEAHGLFAISPDVATAAAGLLLADPTAQPSLVAIPAQTRKDWWFVPDDVVQLGVSGLVVAAADVEALRLVAAAAATKDEIAAARALQLAAVQGSPGRVGKKATEPLSVALAAYEKHSLRGRYTKEDEMKRVRNGCALLIDLMGDMPCGVVDPDLLRRFRADELCRVPDHENKVRLKHKTNSVKESIAAVEGSEYDRMTAGQRDLRISWIRGWFAWLKAQGWIADDPGAPLEGESVLTAAEARMAATRDDEKREVFTDTHLSAIFGATWFRAGGSDGGRGYCPYWFWLPLIGAFTGCRIAEACQLHLDNIGRTDTGTWFISFEDGSPDQLLKKKKARTAKSHGSASPSRRVVPVHPAMVELGFGCWVDALRAAGYRRLFPELVWREKPGYSGQAVKFFSGLMESLGYPRDGRLTFHSFRHLFVNALPEDTPQRMQNQLSGHARAPDVRGSVYGKDVVAGAALPFVTRLAITLPTVAPFDVAAGLVDLRKALMRKIGPTRGVECMGPLGVNKPTLTSASAD